LPLQIRDRLNRDHEISQLLEQIQRQSTALLTSYNDPAARAQRTREIQAISTSDPFDEFYRQVAAAKEHHARYPNEQAENSEVRYKVRRPGEVNGVNGAAQENGVGTVGLVDYMFSGEEAFGRFFDLHSAHEAYLNLPGVKRLTYLQYLEVFDSFGKPDERPRRADKLSDAYFRYVRDLAQYLESFMRRTRPLENLDKVLADFDADFVQAWDKDELPGWASEKPGAADGTNGTAASKRAAPALSSSEAVWCDACQKEFKNENVYKGHLNGRNHKKNVERQQAAASESSGVIDQNGTALAPAGSAHRLKERAVAEREYRIKRLAGAMSTEREDTRVNVERRAGMTERERQQELENLFGNSSLAAAQQARQRNGGEGEDDEDDDEERIYNPLKLPMGWDGKPIPFWLYKLHGLGVEFPCEICGNYVYMGRRAFDKHFNEARHIYGLRCLGITDTHMFRDISDIGQALRLWEKIQREEKKSKEDEDGVEQMEDAEGNVMPKKVYEDLVKQGIL
jgi:splicing factor 3A subunit 3